MILLECLLVDAVEVMESKEDDNWIMLVHVSKFTEELLQFFAEVVAVAHG